MFNFYEKISKLKNVERKGWKIRDVKNPENNRVESDAEHTFSMCMLAIKIMNAENLKLNQEKVLKMCLYHDLCEIEAGDTTPFDNLTKQAKYDKEIESIISVSYVADMPEILNLWKEFEEFKTPESKFVKAMDKLDMLMQAKVYAKVLNKPELVEEFYNSALPYIADYVKYI